ncbi:hypothetical protein ABT112_11735 [Streptomyces sp. NPDC002055]|uniref:hypothetical protein n=1 Tax=Streptomyces sp. NPDC002055 TaxID=3154534 RepID=UPI0033230618
MAGQRTVRLAAASLLAVVLGLTGCGNDHGPGVATADGSPTARGSADPDDGKRAREYAACMRRHGVVLEETSEGLPQVDKDGTPVRKITEAAEKCRDLQPGGTAPEKAAPEDIEKRGRYAACMRRHGVPQYPDPDPRTGEPEMDAELAERIKKDPQTPEALQTCRELLPGAGGSAVNGG